MRSSFRAVWLGIKASYWFIPSLLTLAAFLLALGMIHLDRSGVSESLLSSGWFERSRPEGARAQLTVIASAMIAVSSTVFAITIAAVAYASGNYGPRLLTNFMNDRGNQISLGVFIATFAYNLTVLRVVRSAEEVVSGAGRPPGSTEAFVPQLSMLVSAGTVAVAVIVLVYFLHHIPASIRIDAVLGDIGRRLVGDIEKRFPKEGGATEPEERISGEPVNATGIGYIQIVDFEELDEIARKERLAIALRVRTGDFIHPHLPVVEVKGEVSGDLRERILDCFSLGESRTPTQDLEFLIDELVEIALRALSPGINDPFTAITSMHWMGAALAKLADRDLIEGPEQEDYDTHRIQPLADDFGHFVRRSFGAVRSSVATNPLAARMCLEVLSGVAAGATSAERRSALLEEARALVAQAETELEGPALREVRARIEELERALA